MFPRTSTTKGRSAHRRRSVTLALGLAALMAPLAAIDAAAAAGKRKGRAAPAVVADGGTAPVVVKGVDAADALNLRAGPDPRSAWVAKIPPDARGLLATGRARKVGSAVWREITYGAFTGWVNGKFLTTDPSRWQRTPTLTSGAPKRTETASVSADQKRIPITPPASRPGAPLAAPPSVLPATPAAAPPPPAAIPVSPTTPTPAPAVPTVQPPAPATPPIPAAAPPPPSVTPPARPVAPTARPSGPPPGRAAVIPPGSKAPGPTGALAAAIGEVPGEREFNQCKKLPAGKAIFKLNLKPETDIGDLVGLMSSITCTPILMASTTSLQGKRVTVISPEKLTLAEAYRLFYAALESVGLTIEPSGKFLRILDASKAKLAKLPYYGANDRIPSDKRFITKLLRVEHLDATEVAATVLNRVKSEAGDIIAYRSSLIVTDTADNIERMARLIKDFDLPSGMAESLYMIRVKNMSATEMAARLAEIVPVQQSGAPAGRRGGGRPGSPPIPSAPMPAPMPHVPPGQPPPVAPLNTPTPASMTSGGQWSGSGDLDAEMAVSKMVPDERSNSLLVVANRRAYDWLMTLVRKLDQPLDGGSAKNGNGRVHVYYCENANCDELAQTLSAVAGVQVAGAPGGGSNRKARTSTPGQRDLPGPVPSMGFPGGGANGGGNASSLLLFEGEVRITYDAPTNSLLVVSSFKDFQSLRKVIEKLDGPRKQVFIEAMILEVLLDKSREVGVAYHGGKPVGVGGGDKSLLLGGFEASRTLSPTSLISNLGGLTGALFGPTIPSQNLQLFGTAVQLPSFGVFLQLLQTNNDVNVLSNPSLLITNNQEGEISVGENLPFPGQLLGGFGGGAVPGQPQGGGFQAFPSVGVQRQNVALTMKITPSVNEHNMIRLDVDQVIEDVSAPNYNGLGPATSKRSAKTQVVARDQQTVVIGGLMTDRASETVKKIPILGDIPVLGFFFRSTSKTTKKANIIIALTPYVISDLSDLRRVAEKKLKERREFIERYSALDDKANIEANIDYRRKRGMLEEINRAAREAEEDEAELRRVRVRDSGDDAIMLEPAARKGPIAPGPANSAENPAAALVR